MVTMQGFKRQISQIDQGQKKWVHLSMNNPYSFRVGEGLHGLDNKYFECKIVNIFLPISFKVCFGWDITKHTL